MSQSEADKKPKKPRLNVEIPNDLEATYANLTLISHSASEIIMDFARIMPNKPKNKVHARVVMTPINAKLLYHALGENIKKFEAKYGEIQIPTTNVVIDKDKGFRG